MLAQPIRAALGRGALRIDHIGSTAVPGLAAKDIIDIQVTVQAFDEHLIAQLGAIGYTCRREINRDHQPPGMAGPEREWEKRYFAPPPGQRRTNLHMRAAGSANQRYALLFRDYLHSHAVASGAYAQIKLQLARYHPDNLDAYYDIKDPVCDVIISAAEDWARATRWEPGPSDA